MIHWCLLLYVFSIPFEYAGLSGFASIPFTLEDGGFTVLCDVFLLLQSATGLDKSPQHAWPSPPRAFWWFLAYVAIYILNGFFLPEKFAPQFFLRLFTIAAVDHFLLGGCRPLQRGKNHAAGVVDIRCRIIGLGSWYATAPARFYSRLRAGWRAGAEHCLGLQP